MTIHASESSNTAGQSLKEDITLVCLEVLEDF